MAFSFYTNLQISGNEGLFVFWGYRTKSVAVNADGTS